MAVLAPLDQSAVTASGLSRRTDGIQNHTQQKRITIMPEPLHGFKIFIVYPPKNVTISTIWKD